MSDDLDWMEVTAAAIVGVLRQVRNRSRGAQQRFAENGGPGPWERDIEGACAEKFVAKKLGLYWFDGKGGATDVGPHQVRHTLRLDGRLILYPADKDDEAFILVIGRAPRFEIVGWCYGHEGKRPEFWDEKRAFEPAFFVPRRVLHDIEDLSARELVPA